MGFKKNLYLSSMPANKSALRRYMIIDQVLRNTMRPYPTMDDFLNACADKDIYVTDESIQKDIRFMKDPSPDGFDAPIRYNRTYKGYEYTDPDYSIRKFALPEEDVMAVLESVDLVRSLGGGRFSHKFISAMEKVLSASLEEFGEVKQDVPVLQTMSTPESRGFEYFDLLYKACQRGIPVSFVHYNYLKRRFKSILLHPFLITEFENKWYVHGYSEQHEEVRVFGLDRLYHPMLLKLSYKPTDRSVIQSRLHDMYGVFAIRGYQKCKIRIVASAFITSYFSAYPIHASQKIRKTNGGSGIITFDLIPTLELARLFLSHGKHLMVLGPKWFKDIYEGL